MTRMGRSGEFYDQDEEAPQPGAPQHQEHSGRGMFFDQDSVVDPTPPEMSTAARARQQRVLDRQRERELELRREAEFERERVARRERARAGQPTDGEPLRISSRPGVSTSTVIVHPPASSPRPPTPEAWPDPLRRQPPERAERTARPERAERAERTERREAGGRDAPVARARPGAPAEPAGAPRPPAPAARRGAAPPRGPSRPGLQPPRVGGAPPRRPPSTERATAILAAGTFASRLTGFLRVLAIGYVLGVGTLSDAYNYANGIPNIVYDLLLGGVLSATLIPVFVEHLRSDDQAEGNRAISAVMTAVSVSLVAISGLLWLLAPWLIRFYLLLYPSATSSPERPLATTLLRYFAPQVFFLGAIVVTTAMLNARRSFTAAAVSPVINNLIAIAALLATKGVADHILTDKKASAVATLHAFSHDEHAVWILGIGTTLGYAVQFLVQLPAMRRAGLRLRLVWDWHHPAVRRVARLSTWLVGVVLANQASLALVMVFAGKVSGGFTAYQFSYQFFQLPYALVAVSVASALMPNLAERWSAGDRKGFERQAVVGLRVTMAVLVPAALAYVAVAQPLIQLAVHHGRVNQSGAHLVSSTLALFALGLPGFSAFFLLMRVYQAMQEAKTMFWIYVLENGLTVVFALILDPLLGVPGLALAWVGPYTIASFVAAADLRKRVGRLGGRGTSFALVRILIAGGIASGVVALVGLPWPKHAGDVVLVARLIIQLGAGTLVYVGLASVLGIKELRPIARMLSRLSNRA